MRLIPRARHNVGRTLLSALVWAVALCGPSTSGEAIAADAAVGAVEPVTFDKPLIARWAFDGQAGVDCLDSSGNRNDATSLRAGNEGLERVPGLFGSAMRFSGSHIVGVRERPKFNGLEKLSLSAWVRPTELGSYREIFRQDAGDDRVLFSFQHGGTILSFGLNVDGYMECDAAIAPAQVLDGMWHHCAATFDGRSMRVYLDGRQVGAIDRPGKIAANNSAPGCIGSSNGAENFQGAMDELCIYAEAISAEAQTVAKV